LNVYFELIDDLSQKSVEFYSVKLGDDSLFEFEKFDDKDFPNHEEELQIIYSVINQMQFRGAKHYFFKHEGPANALPKVTQEIIEANKDDLGLRLYCIRLTDNVVVLLNGDIKTKQDPAECENVKVHFKNAIKIAKKLDKAILGREINYQQRDCLQHYEIEI
jgi:hypothetical protein